MYIDFLDLTEYEQELVVKWHCFSMHVSNEDWLPIYSVEDEEFFDYLDCDYSSSLFEEEDILAECENLKIDKSEFEELISLDGRYP